MRRSFNFLTKLPCPSKKTVLLILIVAAITLLLSALISMWLNKVYNLKVPSIGNIHTLGAEAYGGNITLKEDGAQYIDWGTIYPGTMSNRSCYLRSISNVDVKLNLNTSNWNPADISAYMNLTWNYTDTPISPSETIYVTFTLQTASDISFINYLMTNDVKEFSFDIIITAIEK